MPAASAGRSFERTRLEPVIAQSGIATNRRKGTLRGMHFQFPPAAETKLVRCTRGAILDVIVDLRPESQTYLEHVAVELDAGTCALSMCRSASPTDTRCSRMPPMSVMK